MPKPREDFQFEVQIIKVTGAPSEEHAKDVLLRLVQLVLYNLLLCNR